MITNLENSFLVACQEVILRQQELVPALAETLGVQPGEVFYHWVMPPKCQRSGAIVGTDWRYFFHGLECDLKHLSDGRFLRVDFGPGGRFDTFSGWGVMQFVMVSQAPWREFPELRAHLAEKPPPFHELSGSHERMVAIVDKLEELRLIEPVGLERGMVEERDPSKRAFWDACVNHRMVLTEFGKQVIADWGSGV